MPKDKARVFGQDLMRGEHTVGETPTKRRAGPSGRDTAQVHGISPGAYRNPDDPAEFKGDLRRHTVASPNAMALVGGFAEAGNGTGGTSIFDPVLCELVYRWFCPPGGRILDPFAGGSVRGVVAAALGRSYVGIDLRAEQIEANRVQWSTISATLAGPSASPQPLELDPTALTPVEAHGAYWVKRDDQFGLQGIRGGKVRSCWALAQGASGLVTASHRQSPQLAIVATVAKALGVPCAIFLPAAAEPDSPELAAARDAGAEVHEIRPGYTAVISKRARDYAEEKGWRLVPFGMDTPVAVEQTAAQVCNLPPEVQRIVVPVGSGMTLAGILTGLAAAGRTLPVVGVVVGADPRPRLDQYAPGWAERVTLVDADRPYEARADVTAWQGIALDPIYEAKCLPFLQPGDCLWVVGIRPSAEAPASTRHWRVSAKWLAGPHDCTLAGILARCHGGCCQGSSFWPSKAFHEGQGPCGHLGSEGCILTAEDKPVKCLLYPVMLNDAGMLIKHHRTTTAGSVCKGNHGQGAPLIDALRDNLITLFGEAEYTRMRADVLAGRDTWVEVPPEVLAAYEAEKVEEAANQPPTPRSTRPPASMASLPAPVEPVWFEGDARDTLTLCPDEVDLVFSCPPYGDLEVYSDDPRDLSTLDYEDFKASYAAIIRDCVARLKPNRFACFVVGDFRDRHGIYRKFPWHTIEAFEAAGAHLYNEAVLITAVGSLPIRVGRQFESGRKLGKTHQNVLVFVKGDPRLAAEAVGLPEFGDLTDPEASPA